MLHRFLRPEKVLKKLFKTNKIRVPCRSTFHRILSNVSYDGLEVVFRDFFGKYAKGKNIAICTAWIPFHYMMASG